MVLFSFGYSKRGLIMMTDMGRDRGRGATLIGTMHPIHGRSNLKYPTLNKILFGISFGCSEDAEAAKKFIEDLMRNFANDNDHYDPDFKSLEQRQKILDLAIDAFKKEQDIDDVDADPDELVTMDTTPDEVLVDELAQVEPRELKKGKISDPFESLFDAVRFGLIGNESSGRQIDYMSISVTKIEPRPYSIFGIITPKGNPNSWSYFDYGFTTSEMMMASLNLMHNVFDQSDETEVYSDYDTQRIMQLLFDFRISYGIPPEDEINKIRSTLADIGKYAQYTWNDGDNLRRLKEIARIIQEISTKDIATVEVFLQNPIKGDHPDMRVIGNLVSTVRHCVLGQRPERWNRTTIQHERFRHIRSVGPHDGFVYSIL